MRGIRVVVCIILIFNLTDLESQELNNADQYRHWREYQHLEFNEIGQITEQPWVKSDNVIDGWDWSLPKFVKPSPRSKMGLQRIFALEQHFEPMDLNFESNAVAVMWVKWREIEPEPDKYLWKVVKDRIVEANKLGFGVIIRLVGTSKLRGYKDNAIQQGQAPLWLEDLGVPLLPRRDSIKYPNDNLNFDPADPIFHDRYLRLIEEMKKQGIPDLVSGAYVGYASHSNGDEGIGPYGGESDSRANDTVKHVVERLDAWGDAFKGMEHKVFMGGSSEYGFQKGFGVRRGFVEMYMYHIPSPDLGQYVDSNGYLSVNEEAPILKYNCFNGDENEEYGEKWATPSHQYRFGKTTESFPYRFFISNLRALQMRCNYLLLTGHLLPEMVPYVSNELGRTIADTPDVWSFLHTGYIRSQYYTHREGGQMHRVHSLEEKQEGIETKNFERWLFQRDAPGYETDPAVRIDQPIEMWMIQPGKYYDYIARSGKKIGFDIDDRWKGTEGKMAIKISFFDHSKGELLLKFNDGKKSKSVQLTGTGNLRTATIYIEELDTNSMDHEFDFTLEAGKNTDEIVVSMVRVVDVVK